MKKVLFGLAALLLLGAVSAQTLVYGVSGFPSSLDAVDSQDGNSLVVSAQVTERLVDFIPGGTDLIPGLATEWSANEDSTQWVFTLREGVSFHDGTPFNAQAVKFNVDRWNDPNDPNGHRADGKTFVPWGWVFGGPLGEGNLIAEAIVLNDNQIQFNLTQPAPFLPALWAAVYFQFGSPAAIEAAGVAYGTPGVGAVGTGPFMFSEWVEGERVVLNRNDDYWNGPAQVESVVFRGISEPTARLAELQAGTIDIAVLLSVDDLQTVQNDTNLIAAIPSSELNVGYIAMHQGTPPLDNLLVRQAIAHAIDRVDIIDAFYGGLGLPAYAFIPASMAGQGDPWPYDYDPERARELLAEAGYADGFTTQFWYMPVSRPYYPAPQPIAETIASYLADVGITVELMTEDWTTYLADYQTGKFPMYMLGWNADYADPDNFLLTFFGPTAPSDLGWDSPETRDLLQQARQVADPDVRAGLYAQVHNNVNAAAPSIPFAYNRTLNAMRSNIDGWVASPLGYSSVSLHTVTKTE
ncbi:MAG TPA: ABC transporter substrate-binding protein [Trueperaceae bacterium]|nr:ABC transporter substrate-binding protein [Trueperaceae bacterium]